MNPTPTTTTLRGLARALGVRVSRIEKAIASGRLEKSVGYDERGRPLILDVELARREWRENRDADQVRK